MSSNPARHSSRPIVAIALPVLAVLACAFMLGATATHKAGASPLAPNIGQWQLIPPVTANDLRDVDMVTPDEGWAVGENGTLLHYYAGTWHVEILTTTNTLIDVFMLSPTNGYILGWTDTGSAIYHYNGTTWNLEYAPNYSLSRIDGSSATNVWAVGLDTTLHWDGATWTFVPPPVQRQIFAVQVNSDNDVWAFGQLEPVSGHGLILHYTNGAWTQVASPAPQTLFDGFFLAPNDGWAVGTAVTDTYVLRYDGTSWRRAYTNTLGIYRLFMLSPTDGWATGQTPNGSTISHFDGADWQPVTNPATQPLNSLFMLSPYEGWIVGGSGTVLHYTDTTITATATATAIGTTITPTSIATATATRTATRTPTPQVTATAPSTATPCSITFTDVQPADYFYTAVQYLYCRGVISGYADNTFRPGNNTTRGQLSKIVALAEQWPNNTAGGPHFTDVPTSNPFYAYIETAYNSGVISGYADGTFRWGNNVTRGQLCKIIVLSEGWSIDTTGGPHFTDLPAADPFYAFIETGYNHSIISGYADNTFRPGNNATRGQISKIVFSAVTQP